MKKDLRFSEAVTKIQEIIAKLESGELELEEVDKLVAEGLELLETARSRLAKLESKIEKVIKER